MGADDLVDSNQMVAVVENHNGDAYAYTASNARNSYYSISGFPTAILTGSNSLLEIIPIACMHHIYRYTIQNMPWKLPFGITISAGNRSGNIYTLNVVVDKFGETPFANSNLVLQLALTQSHILVNWQGQTHLEFVSRAMAPDASGTPVDLQM